MIVKEKAICLSKTKYGEADLILKLLTSKGEVLSAIAKSALKSKKRFGGGVLEPTHFILATIHRRPAADSERLSVLNEAVLLDDFLPLKKDYDRIQMALQFLQMIGLVASEGDSHPELFNLLGHSLKALGESADMNILRTQFEIKFLHLQGMLPHEEQYQDWLRTPVREHKNLNSSHSVASNIKHLLQGYLGQ